MIRLDNITLAIGGHELLQDASWHVHPGEKFGLVGRNGSGKSTLLRAILGELSPELGRLELRPGASVGHLAQHAKLPPEETAWSVARGGMARLLHMEAELARLRAQAEQNPTDELLARVERAESEFRLAGGYRMDESVGEVLSGLGFAPETWQRPAGTFSGGWQVRLNLARLLLSDHDLLLLDEPTNHLDLLARGWLAGFLAQSRAAVVMVSHDRHLLDTACDRIAEIRSQRLHLFKGNFSRWLAERELREEQAREAFESQQEEIEKLERFVARFKGKPTKASQAQSRQKRLDRIERIELDPHEKDPRLHLPEPPPSSLECLLLSRAKLGWPDGPDILGDVELRLERGQRIALLGPNGAGKSTLLAALAGSLPVRSGRRVVGQGVRIGLFTQDLSRDLPADRTAYEEVSLQAPAAPESRVRAALGALGLGGDAALRPIGVLSGGEKARVLLAGFALRPTNVLLLDEPTNHLDVGTVEVLAEALAAYAGGVILSTHDRYLVERVATHVAHVHQGRLAMHEGVWPTDFELEPLAGWGDGRNEESASAHATRKAARREQERAQRRAEAVQKEIEAAEARVGAIDAELAEVAQAERITALARERAALEQKIEALFTEWGELEARLAAG